MNNNDTKDNGLTIILIIIVIFMVFVGLSGTIGINTGGFIWALVTIVLITYILYRQELF